MKSFLKVAITAAALCVAPIASAELPTQVNGQSMPSLAPMLQHTMPAVVNITGKGKITQQRDPFSEPADTRGHEQEDVDGADGKSITTIGSGVIVDAKHGVILTNAHLITQADTITVTLNDGRHFKAKLLGADVASDIAVLQIKASHLHALKMADSNKLNVGDFVVAIGSPFGLNQTVTSGVVSALERNDLGIEGYENFIQTDASINPGNSGGALVNLKGELIGINTAILAPNGGNVGIGFAIPSNMANNVMMQLIKYGELSRGIAGIMIQTLTPELAKAFHDPKTKGAIVTQVSPHSPAAQAGLKIGDVIEQVNGKAIKTAGQVRNTIGLMRAGSAINVQFVRNGKAMQASFKTENPKAFKEKNEADNPYLYGMALKNFDAQMPNIGQLAGVQVLHITESSLAWQAGLRPGDIITSANHQPVHNMQELQNIAAKSKHQLLVNIFRDSGAMFVLLKG